MSHGSRRPQSSLLSSPWTDTVHRENPAGLRQPAALQALLFQRPGHLPRENGGRQDQALYRNDLLSSQPCPIPGTQREHATTSRPVEAWRQTGQPVADSAECLNRSTLRRLQNPGYWSEHPGQACEPGPNCKIPIRRRRLDGPLRTGGNHDLSCLARSVDCRFWESRQAHGPPRRKSLIRP